MRDPLNSFGFPKIAYALLDAGYGYSGLMRFNVMRVRGDFTSLPVQVTPVSSSWGYVHWEIATLLALKGCHLLRTIRISFTCRFTRILDTEFESSQVAFCGSFSA